MTPNHRYRFANENKEEARSYLTEYIEQLGFKINEFGKVLCPFHHDHNPSLGFHDNFQKWKCHACDAGGDVFDFSIKLRRSFSFVDSVIDVAVVVGLKVPLQILNICEVKRKLKDAQNRRRNGTRVTRTSFDAKKAAKADDENVDPYEIELACLEVKFALEQAHRDDPAVTKQFADYLGIPVIVITRHFHGASGLGLVGDKLVYVYPAGIKLRNPKGTYPRFLWLLGKATMPWRFNKVTANITKIFLTESESDALALVASGVEDNKDAVVVASPGTSFPRKWVPLFENKHVIICFDFDPAGQSAAKKVAELLRPNAASVKIIPAPAQA